MGVVCKRNDKLLEENRKLKNELNEIKIRQKELETTGLINDAKILMLNNNNELLKMHCINLQSQLMKIFQQKNLNWNLINTMNFQGNRNQFVIGQCQQMNNNTNNGYPVIINMIFIINQKEKVVLPVLSNYQLNNIYKYICSISNYTINRNKIKFTYNAQDITNYFFGNEEVSSLNICSDEPVINITL